LTKNSDKEQDANRNFHFPPTKVQYKSRKTLPRGRSRSRSVIAAEVSQHNEIVEQPKGFTPIRNYRNRSIPVPTWRTTTTQSPLGGRHSFHVESGNFAAVTPSHCSVIKKLFLREIYPVNLIRVGRPTVQALKSLVTALEVAVLLAKTERIKIKSLIGLAVAISLWPIPALAQGKNEVGLVIGGIVTPSQTLSPGASFIGPGGTALPNRDIAINSSLTLGAEYDRTFVLKRKFAIGGGVDFLASPFDVKLSQQTQNAIGQYAFIFLTPHVRVKFHPDAVFSPWLSFGGGYARFLENSPTAAPSFKPGTNTGTFVFGGGVDTRPVVRVLKIPIGFRIEVRDFYSGLPNYNVKVNGNLQNNLAFNGGLLIRF
jgi:hypothetical protein